VHEYTNKTVKAPSSILLLTIVILVKCLGSLVRNKAKNALSLAVPISPGMAGAKIEKISFRWREKK
jgi:hypothetical protein